LLGGHHGPRAIDQFRLDGRAADVDGECEPVVVVHCARMRLMIDFVNIIDKMITLNQRWSTLVRLRDDGHIQR
jgi:hypothetical protein